MRGYSEGKAAIRPGRVQWRLPGCGEARAGMPRIRCVRSYSATLLRTRRPKPPQGCRAAWRAVPYIRVTLV